VSPPIRSGREFSAPPQAWLDLMEQGAEDHVIWLMQTFEQRVRVKLVFDVVLGLAKIGFEAHLASPGACTCRQGTTRRLF
jgi:hypothetical protein